MGKGSKQRPRHVDEQTFNDNWDRIFGKKPKNVNEDSHKEKRDGRA
jgi:hypothetical protein